VGVHSVRGTDGVSVRVLFPHFPCLRSPLSPFQIPAMDILLDGWEYMKRCGLGIIYCSWRRRLEVSGV